jgi:SGNH domain (fused to AT3 domains)
MALEPCTFAPEGTGRQVMIWGDSHGDQLMPLLEAVAPGAGLNVYQRSLSGCPPLLGVMPTLNGKPNRECAMFNQAVLTEIRERRRQGLAGVVLSARWSVYDDRPSLSVWDYGTKFRFIKHAGDTDAPLEVFEAAMKNTLGALTQMGLRVLVIGPVPEQRYNAPWCLARSDPATCSVTRQEAESDRADVLAVLARAVARSSSVRLADPFGPLCDALHCLVERGGAILYSDDDHLTATGARSLAPWFAQSAAWLAGPGKFADAAP